MSDFKPGNRIKALEGNDKDIIPGQVYTVRKLDNWDDPILEHEPVDEKYAYPSRWFELVEEQHPTVEELEKICKDYYRRCGSDAGSLILYPESRAVYHAGKLLAEQDKPERMFACERYGSPGVIDAPDVLSNFSFTYEVPYYEVMPETGDYRRVPDEELTELREAAKK